MAKEIKCSSCGKTCLDTQSYCRYCQTPLTPSEDNHDKPIEGVAPELWKEFINENSSHYIEIFRKNEGKKFFLNFNPAAFLIPTYWMLYRKMYLPAVIIHCILFLSVLLVYVLGEIGGGLMLLAIPIIVLVKIAISLIVDSIYKSHCLKHLSVREPDMSRGGVSYGIAIGGGLALELISSFLLSLIEIHLLLPL